MNAKELDVYEFVKKYKKSLKTDPDYRLAFKKPEDTDSHALRSLKIAAQNRVLWKYIVNLGIPDEEKNYIYKYLSCNNVFISNVHIFQCREAMQPAKWYININEKLPERVSFTPKFDISCLQYKETVGHKMLKGLQAMYSLPVVAEKFGIELYQLKNIRYKRMHPVTRRRVFKSLPSKSVVIKFKDVINPDYWFIFPEEMEQAPSSIRKY